MCQNIERNDRKYILYDANDIDNEFHYKINHPIVYFKAEKSGTSA
jgi:hypothetical protein